MPNEIQIKNDNKELQTNENPASKLLNSDYFEQIQRVATMFSKSQMIPDNYRNIADCAVAIHIAYQKNIDPIHVLQNTQIIKGNFGWKSPAIISMINKSGLFTQSLNWDFERDKNGEIIKATCFTFDLQGNRREATVTWEMVTGEGWDRNSKWRTMREQMFKYRSASFFARSVCPEIFDGQTIDEISDTAINEEINKSSKKADLINNMEINKDDIESDIQIVNKKSKNKKRVVEVVSSNDNDDLDWNFDDMKDHFNNEDN